MSGRFYMMGLPMKNAGHYDAYKPFINTESYEWGSLFKSTDNRTMVSLTEAFKKQLIELVSSPELKVQC